MKSIFKKILFCLFVAAFPVLVQAQPDPGGDPDDTPIPFDGGISLVIAAGVGYGIKKARDAQRKKAEQEK